MAKFVTEGLNRIANILLGATAVDSTLYLGIYTNSSEPAVGTALASITEPSGYGYARIALSRGSWSIVNAIASYAQQTFAASGGNWGNCYGYFIATVASGAGKLLAVEHFSDGPYNIFDSYQIKVTPQITLS